MRQRASADTGHRQQPHRPPPRFPAALARQEHRAGLAGGQRPCRPAPPLPHQPVDNAGRLRLFAGNALAYPAAKRGVRPRRPADCLADDAVDAAAAFPPLPPARESRLWSPRRYLAARQPRPAPPGAGYPCHRPAGRWPVAQRLAGRHPPVGRPAAAMVATGGGGGAHQRGRACRAAIPAVRDGRRRATAP